jgi:2-polyprenyl-3-methyl-5-hydroxy-6-metoxy-1,4-benzoquinol methylase
MTDDRVKWNKRYGGDGLYLGRDPSRFLAENIPLIKDLAPGKKALDIACGEGRNSIFLARNGFDVAGMDISEEGLVKAEQWAKAEGLAVAFRCIDLETFAFNESYDLIINFNFLLRSLVPIMVQALNPGGVIVFDTILDSPSLEGFHNREYLLQPGELREIFSPFSGEILLYEELPFGPSPTARLIFHNNLSEYA